MNDITFVLPASPTFISTDGHSWSFTDWLDQQQSFFYMKLTTGKSISSPATYQNILCIEEHGEISILLSRMLSKSECKILHAINKAQAEYLLQTQQPALVLIDNNFYANGGTTYAAELKAMFPTVKLMMLSAAQDGQIKQAASHAGVDVFLIKPFTKSQLLDSVSALLNLEL